MSWWGGGGRGRRHGCHGRGVTVAIRMAIGVAMGIRIAVGRARDALRSLRCGRWWVRFALAAGTEKARFQPRICRDWLPAISGMKERSSGARPRFGLVFKLVQGSFCSFCWCLAERFRLGRAGRLLPECRPCCSLKLTGMPPHTDLLGKICCWKPRRRTGLQQQYNSFQWRLQPTRRNIPQKFCQFYF